MSLWGWRQKMDADRAIMECKQIQAYKDQQRAMMTDAGKINVKFEFLKAKLEALLLDQSISDRACDWRTWRICYKGKYTDVNITDINLFLKSELFQKMFVLPIKNVLQEEKHEKENIKMTRKEAIELAKKIGNEKPWFEDTVSLLEALGLIKFEEEPKEPDWVTNYKSMNIKDMVIEIVNITHYRTQTKNYNERIAFLKSQLQLKLDQY